MPHTTHAYPFESKVAHFAGDLSGRFTAGSSLRSFLLTLDQACNVVALLFEDDSPGWQEKVRALEAAAVPHLFYDPLDGGVEYIWLGWQGVERPVMERLLGQQFEDADFLPLPVFAGRARELPQGKEFPVSWGVMF